MYKSKETKDQDPTIRNNDSKGKRNKGKSRKTKKNNATRADRGAVVTKVEIGKEPLSKGNRDNDPNWYFRDKMLADQVSQLSFQQLAGYPLNYSGITWDIPNIIRVNFNPCPGVILTENYENPNLDQMSGINLAGFRIFSKLSAYTGRVASYAPQDISTMILAFGEIISVMEWMRRVFGIANAYNMRNRDYPKRALSYGCRVDPDNFFANYANYRTRFNTLVTMVNQLPIPKGIAYFDKCAAMYEKVYLDDNSSMAQSIFTAPFSTWILDETSLETGSLLRTVPWMAIDDPTDQNGYLDQPVHEPRTFKYYLDTADSMIGALLNSSSLQVVYTDLINLANKVGQEFWKLDYLPDGYLVIPEFSLNFSLQMHNATIAGPPTNNHQEFSVIHLTSWNDVEPNPVTNTLYYNPGFNTVKNAENGLIRTGSDVLIDMLNDNPTVEDRVEVTRYTSISGLKYYSKNRYGTVTPNSGLYDATLPDHYVVSVSFETQNTAKQRDADNCAGSIARISLYNQYGAYCSMIDWAPRLYECNEEGTALTGLYVGDLNYYTVVNESYLRKLHQFVTLGLYDLQ